MKATNKSNYVRIIRPKTSFLGNMILRKFNQHFLYIVPVSLRSLTEILYVEGAGEHHVNNNLEKTTVEICQSKIKW